ncbi:MAG: agglutinin biogenesis protein MshP, partial [Proteobacteria bacterium]|nr:agglutinin biogenesis protein MshP [Burkholderiales bacterium]
MPRQPMRQRGFAILGAFFLVIVLGALGVAMARMTAQNQAGAALDVQGARAFEAARTGIEWASWQVLNPASAPACFAATTLTFPDGA